MVCRGSHISLYSLNGALLLEQPVCEAADDCILSCAFYEGANNEWLERELLFTGHRRGLVNVSGWGPSRSVFLFLTLYRSGAKRYVAGGSNSTLSVSSITSMLVAKGPMSVQELATSYRSHISCTQVMKPGELYVY